MNEGDISIFPIPELADLPDDIRDRIVAVQEKSGFVPNVFLLMARRPDEFRAFFAYHDVLMDRDGALSKAEREMIVVATSAMNDCHYCVIAHGAILRIRARNPLIADQVAINFRKAELSERQAAILDLAIRIAGNAGAVTVDDIEGALAQGFTQEEIWDIGAITAFFAMSNRLANVAQLRPNAEFYAMGRENRG